MTTILLGAAVGGILVAALYLVGRSVVRRGAAAVRPTMPAAPLANSALGTPGSDPKWVHETLVLKIGAHEYAFRTFSLYTVWLLWGHLRAFKDATLQGRPLLAVEHALVILRWIQPELAANDADCAAFAKDQ